MDLRFHTFRIRTNLGLSIKSTWTREKGKDKEREETHLEMILFLSRRGKLRLRWSPGYSRGEDSGRLQWPLTGLESTVRSPTWAKARAKGAAAGRTGGTFPEPRALERPVCTSRTPGSPGSPEPHLGSSSRP